jgi:hypothetical protein
MPMPPATIVQGLIGSEPCSVTADASGLTGTASVVAWCQAEQPTYDFQTFTDELAPRMALLFGDSLRLLHYTDDGPAPRPVLLHLDPPSIVSGGEDVTLHCYGYDFTPRSVIVFNGGEEVTMYESATHLTTIVEGATATTPGVYPVSVRTPGPEGGESGALPFAVLEAVEPEAASEPTDPPAPPQTPGPGDDPPPGDPEEGTSHAL